MSTAPAKCNKCADVGFTNELIKFQQDGTKADGSKKWLILNASDGSEHVHKSKQEAPKPAPSPPSALLTPEQQRQADIQKAHLENIESSKLLTQAINRLAAALEARK